MEFESVFVDVPSASFFVLRWTLTGGGNVQDYRIDIQRSGNTKNPKKIASLPATSTRFVDNDIPVRRRWLPLRYTFQLVEVSSGNIISEKSFRAAQSPFTYGVAMADDLRLRLRTTHGREVWFLRQKVSGQRCPVCYDSARMRKNKSNCSTCYGTTYVGGFDDPEKVHVSFKASPELIEKTPFAELEQSQTVAWMANYPDARPGDFFIELDNRRWNVVNVENFEYRRTPFRQIMVVDEVSPGDIRMKINHPEFE